MEQKLVCHKNSCYEEDTLEREFDSLFDDTNMVEAIERDLWEKMLS